ncbi:MAG: carboxypeptidase-like regulatory domain-containing protein [Candidatus Micrarchaeia archaeon]
MGRNFNASRAQGSAEYLVILGAVIAVSLIVVNAVGGFPSFATGEGGVMSQQSKAYWSSAYPFAITGLKLSSGDIAITLTNRLDEQATLTAVFFNTSETGLSFWPTDASQSQAFAPGQSVTLYNSSFGVAQNPCVGKQAGASFEFESVDIVYSTGPATGVNQGGSSLSGTCASSSVPSPTPAPSPSPLPLSYAVLSGWVYDAYGAGVSGAVVSLNSTSPQSATANASGYYSLNASFAGPTATFVASASAGASYNSTTALVTLSAGVPESQDFVISAWSAIQFLVTIQDDSGNNVALFTPTGGLVLAGGCYSGASCAAAPSGPFVVRDAAGVARAYINTSGSLCIEDANCNDYDASCAGAPEGSFVVQNLSGINVSYISPSGSLCLMGGLRQYGTP